MNSPDSRFAQNVQYFPAVSPHELRMKCDEEWVPDEAEVEYLATFATRAHAILAIGDVDRAPPWQIGKAAGFSGGTTSDLARRRANWSSAVSKGTRYRRKLLPHIAALQEHLKRLRNDGDKPDSVSWRDMLARCDYLIRNGTPAESMRAIELKGKLAGVDRQAPTARDVVARAVAKVGAERARAGFQELGFENLVPLVAELAPAEVEAGELRSLNGADIEKRLAALEQQTC